MTKSDMISDQVAILKANGVKVIAIRERLDMIVVGHSDLDLATSLKKYPELIIARMY